MTYNVVGGTLSLTQSINQSSRSAVGLIRRRRRWQSPVCAHLVETVCHKEGQNMLPDGMVIYSGVVYQCN